MTFLNMTDQQLITFSMVTLALTLSPGVDTMLVIRNVLRGGKLDGIITTIGICSGLFVHASLSALGISVILVNSAIAFSIMKFVGACYLLYLGIKTIWSAYKGKSTIAVENNNTNKRDINIVQSLREGVLSNVLNPKPAIFYFAFLPQFITSKDPVLLKSIMLAGIHFAMGMVWLITLSFILGYIRNFITKPSTAKWIDGTCGTVLIGLGIRLALEKN